LPLLFPIALAPGAAKEAIPVAKVEDQRAEPVMRVTTNAASFRPHSPLQLQPSFVDVIRRRRLIYRRKTGMIPRRVEKKSDRCMRWALCLRVDDEFLGQDTLDVYSIIDST
jgi:hypothetical protein